MKLCALLLAVASIALGWSPAVVSAKTSPKTFYVTVKGRDGATGSQKYPWRTLQYAADHAPAGSRIVVRAGTYAGFSAGKPQTWTASGKVIVDLKRQNPVFYVSSGTTSITGFNFYCAGYDLPLVQINHHANLVFNNNKLTGSLSWYVLLLNDVTGELTANSNTVKLSGPANSFFYATRGGSGIVNVDDNHITDKGALKVPLFDVDNGSFLENFVGNNVYLPSGAEKQPIISLTNQPEPLIAHNRFVTSAPGYSPQIVIQSTGSGGAPIIYANMLYSSAQSGYVIDVGSEGSGPGDGKLNGAQILDNGVFGPYFLNSTMKTYISTHAIFVGFNVNATIDGNIVWGEGYGVVVKSAGQTYTGGGILNNTFTDDKGVFAIFVKGANGVSIVDNQVSDNSTEGFANAQPIAVLVNQGANNAPATDATIRGNSVTVHGPSGPLIQTDSASQPGLSSDDNQFCQSDGGPVGEVDSTTYDKAQWQMAGYDTHSIFTASCASSMRHLHTGFDPHTGWHQWR